MLTSEAARAQVPALRKAIQPARPGPCASPPSISSPLFRVVSVCEPRAARGNSARLLAINGPYPIFRGLMVYLRLCPYNSITRDYL